MGLDTFLSEDDGISFCRSLGSMPMLYPMGLRNYFSNPPVPNTPTTFAYYDARGDGKEVRTRLSYTHNATTWAHRPDKQSHKSTHLKTATHGARSTNL